MINYYEYETSPRKLKPEYERRTTTKKKTRTQKKVQSTHAQSVDYSRKTAKYIIEIVLTFAVLLTISYRYSLINSKFTEKEELKSELSAIQKENAQIQLNIEKSTNINNIEQQAKEKLGMKKLDNNQKIYVNLPKEDHVKSATDSVETTQEETWWQALINDLFGK